jgi:hypothetical protein
MRLADFEAGARWALSQRDRCDACGGEMTWPVMCEKCEAGIEPSRKPYKLDWKRPEDADLERGSLYVVVSRLTTGAHYCEVEMYAGEDWQEGGGVVAVALISMPAWLGVK